MFSGVEMVKASTDDVASLEIALAGSYGVFAVTNYWEIFDQAKEVQMVSFWLNFKFTKI